MALAIVAGYLAVVLGIGLASNRLLRRTGEDYFVASRTIGPGVLLLSLFGTNMTAFSILGASAEGYRRGVAVFGLMASSSALVIPLVFLFVGTRVWALGKRFGYLSPVQYLRERFGSEGFGLLYFVLLIAFVGPHLLTAPLGGGLTLKALTQGPGSEGLPVWVGALLICAPVLVYVYSGGMRGTAWVQSFETLVFMTSGLVVLAVVLSRLGGLGSALEAVAGHPDPRVSGLLRAQGNVGGLEFLAYTLIPLSVGTFPHMWVHLLTARTARTFKLTVVAYPLCIAAVWVPSVLLGVICAGRYGPDLPDREVNSVLIRLISEHSPVLLGGLVGAAVFAAIMSTLDSQVLALGSMFTQEVVVRYGLRGGPSGRAMVWIGRTFVAGLLAAVFFGALEAEKDALRIFALSIWSFTGFTALLPIVIAALFWRRANRQGAFAAALGVAVLFGLCFWLCGFGTEETLDLGKLLGLDEPFRVMPVLPVTAVSALLMACVSCLTPPPPPEIVERFFGSPP